MEIINFLRAFAEQNGAVDVIVLIATMILTNLVKMPIKKHGEKMSTLARKAGFNVSKSFFTSKIVYLPFLIAFVLLTIAGGIQAIGGIKFDFVGIVVKTPVLASTSIGLYSLIAKTIEKTAQKDEYEKYKEKQTIEEAEKQEIIEKHLIDQLENDNNNAKPAEQQTNDQQPKY